MHNAVVHAADMRVDIDQQGTTHVVAWKWEIGTWYS